MARELVVGQRNECRAAASAGQGALAEAIEARLRTGRPLGAEAWIVAKEASLGRSLRPKKPGPKPGWRQRAGVEYCVPGVQRLALDWRRRKRLRGLMLPRGT